MNLHEIPYKVVVSLPHCSERRWKLHETLCKLGVTDLECEHPVPIKEINSKDYRHLTEKALPYISQILTLQRVFKEAKSRNASSVWILEDDVVFHPDFHDRVRRLRIPNNWCFLYLGGAYYEDVFRVNEGLVRPSRILDLHSVIVKHSMYDAIEIELANALADVKKKEIFADVIFAELHKEFPAYLCRPNLAWQIQHKSDLNGRNYTNYTVDGQQWHRPSTVPFTAVYTLSTKGADARSSQTGINDLVRYFKRSAYLAQQQFSRTVLYTDAKGRGLLKSVYFDDVHLTLEALKEGPLSEYNAKLDTFMRQEEPFVHLEPGVWAHENIAQNGDELIVSNRVCSAFIGTKCLRLMKSITFKPEFMDDLLQSGQNLKPGGYAILGGTDVDFIKWYAQLSLDILHKPENQSVFLNMQGRAPNAIAFQELVFALCCACRGKVVNPLALLPAKFVKRSGPGKSSRSIEFIHLERGGAGKPLAAIDKRVDILNEERALLSVASSRFVEYAKHGRGWYVDLANIKYKAIVNERGNFAGNMFRRTLRDVIYASEYNEESMTANEFENGKHGSSLLDAENRQRLSIMNICRQARQSGSNQCLILHSDVEFHPSIYDALCMIRVPYDWTFIYLGGKSMGNEEWVGRGLIKSNCVYGLYGMIVRTEITEEMEALLDAPLLDKQSCEERISALHKDSPTYLFKPELAWIGAGTAHAKF